MVIHYLTPTNDRLTAINLSQTNRCSTCGADDTIQRRLTQCGVSQMIWNWTRARIAAITRTNSLYAPKEWTLVPISTYGLPRDIRLSCGCWHI